MCEEKVEFPIRNDETFHEELTIEHQASADLGGYGSCGCLEQLSPCDCLKQLGPYGCFEQLGSFDCLGQLGSCGAAWSTRLSRAA